MQIKLFYKTYQPHEQPLKMRGTVSIPESAVGIMLKQLTV